MMPRPLAPDEAAMEARAIRDEAIAHSRRMRMHLQRRLFDDELFAPVKRSLLAEVESFERKFRDEPERAA